ncbi:MAG: TolB family protein, partial [Anaerolineae bacterium]
MRPIARWLLAVAVVLPLVMISPRSSAQAQTQSRDWYVGRILFKSDRGGNEAIYAVNPDGSDLEIVTDPNVGYYYAEALQNDITSADGRYKLYIRLINGNSQIWQQDTETGAVAYIAGGAAGADYEPAWAPDSRYVAYVSQIDEGDEIHLVDRQTGEDRRLTNNTWEWDKHPSFNSDGSQIVFWSNREAQW